MTEKEEFQVRDHFLIDITTEEILELPDSDLLDLVAASYILHQLADLEARLRRAGLKERVP